MNNYENKILDAIELVVDSKLQQQKYDKTIKAKILKYEDSLSGKYLLQYQNSNFYAYSNNIDEVYSDDSMVYVLIPNNDTSQIKTILGKASTENKQENISQDSSLYEVKGRNCIYLEKNSFSACSYKEEEKTIYDLDTNIDLLI